MQAMDQQTQILIVTALAVCAGAVIAFWVVTKIIGRRSVVSREREALGLGEDETADVDAKLHQILSREVRSDKSQ